MTCLKFSFGLAVGEPVAGPHDAHTRRLGCAVVSIAGYALIAVYPILADPVDVKKGDQLCETVSQPSIQPDKVDPPMGSWPRPGLDVDHIGQIWEDSNMLNREIRATQGSTAVCACIGGRGDHLFRASWPLNTWRLLA